MTPYDLIIIGGGINGACIARDAALRGLTVLLLEREDYACGASSKSTKLAHGGIRYLEGLQFGLVYESLQERNLLLKNASLWVKPLPFVFPVYRGDRRPLWMVKLGLHLYDLLAWGAPVPRHSNLKAEEIQKRFPGIRSEGLSGGCLYYDAQMEDGRLVIENILSANQAGATTRNHTAVVGLLKKKGKVIGVRTRSLLDGRETEELGRVVVNVTGAWNNETLALDTEPPSCHIRATKGVHLVIPRMQSDEALVLSAPQDGRIFFLMPWEGLSLVGTTDTDYKGDPSRIDVTEQDVTYLLTALRHYFPENCPDKSAIVSAFAGLRPLADERKGSPSSVSREHHIGRSENGLISLVGGKYTTSRRVAEEVVDRVVTQGKFGPRPCKTRELPFQPHPHNGPPLCAYHPETLGQLTAAIQQEGARTLEDWFYRRTLIGYGVCGGRHCLNATADHFAALLGWSQAEKEKQKNHYASTLHQNQRLPVCGSPRI